MGRLGSSQAFEVCWAEIGNEKTIFYGVLRIENSISKLLFTVPCSLHDRMGSRETRVCANRK